MKKLKKFLSLFLSLLMIMSMFAGLDVSSFAETQSVLIYEINDGEAIVTKCDQSASGELVIPDTIGGCPVTSIGDRAFEDCKSLTSITIPDSVTGIGFMAFVSCSSLTSITIPDSVTGIGMYAFHGCTSLTSITIPNSVTSIGDYAFECCDSLTSITIPGSVTSIGDGAFYNTGYYNDESNWEDDVLYIDNHCISAKDTISGSYTIKDGTICIADNAFYGCTSLTSITIPDSVTDIGDSAFWYCTNLTNFTVDDKNPYYSSDLYGVLFNKDKTTLIAYLMGNSNTSYEIPDSVTNNTADVRN